jgi:thymidylate kinase
VSNTAACDSSLSSEAEFLGELFRRLNEADTRYAVLRNFEHLPYSVMGGDLDLLIHPGDCKNALRIIADTIDWAGGAVLGSTRSPGFTQILAFGRMDSKTSEWWGLCLDVFDDVRYMGAVPLLSQDVWVSGCDVMGNIKVLNPGLAAVLGVLKELIHNDRVPLRYRDRAVAALTEQYGDILTWLAPVGRTGIELLSQILRLDSELKNNAAIRKGLRRKILIRAILRGPVNYFRGLTSFYVSRLKRISKPGGLVIALLGTDGAGKSTIISSLGPIFVRATHGAYIVKHLRPGFLPPLARFRGIKVEQDTPVVNPHGSSQSGIFGSIARIVYLTLDYMAGYWAVVWPKLAKVPSAIVLFDRYAFDMLIDPKRFRIKLPHKLVALFVSLAPRPDITFCLYAPAELIHSRKKEMPLEETRRQVRMLKSFAETHDGFVLISTEGSVEESRDSILSSLRDFCYAKGNGGFY